MRIAWLILLVVFTSNWGFAQNPKYELNSEENENIFLIGESHFVKEKFDEIKSLYIEKISELKKGDKVTFFFELPYSLNYAFSQIKENNDTTLFSQWFSHLYHLKDEKATSFWLDYKSMIIDLLNISKAKEIDIDLCAIDTEVKLRRTVFILSNIVDNPQMDSLLAENEIENSEANKSILIDNIDSLLLFVDDEKIRHLLMNIKRGLSVKYLICKKRDAFMHEMFVENFKAESSLNFVFVGLSHAVSKHDFTDAGIFYALKYIDDAEGYMSFYDMLDSDMKRKTYRVGILALNHVLTGGSFSAPKYYKNIMTKKERLFLENNIQEDGVYRGVTRNTKKLRKLSKHLDYIIIYHSSGYKSD